MSTKKEEEKKGIRLPLELPDPLDFLEQLESAIEETQETITEVDTRVRKFDERTHGIDRRFALPKISPIEKTSAPSKNRDIVNLVRSQFNFTCSICEDIAEKVSNKLPKRTDQIRVYEAVYQLTSEDKRAKDEAVLTLEDLGLLEDVTKEIKENWEKLKEREG